MYITHYHFVHNQFSPFVRLTQGIDFNFCLFVLDLCKSYDTNAVHRARWCVCRQIFKSFKWITLFFFDRWLIWKLHTKLEIIMQSTIDLQTNCKYTNKQIEIFCRRSMQCIYNVETLFKMNWTKERKKKKRNINEIVATYS